MTHPTIDKDWNHSLHAEYKDIVFIESDFVVPRTIDQYINAWRSVKNKYWDLSTKEGTWLFDSAWTAQTIS